MSPDDVSPAQRSAYPPPKKRGFAPAATPAIWQPARGGCPRRSGADALAQRHDRARATISKAGNPAPDSHAEGGSGNRMLIFRHRFRGIAARRRPDRHTDHLEKREAPLQNQRAREPHWAAGCDPPRNDPGGVPCGFPCRCVADDL